MIGYTTRRDTTVAVPDDVPSIAVIDEVPWLVEQDPEFEGALQTVWDRHLSAKPVLLILVGSDMPMMEALQSYGRPFFGRAAKTTVRPLHLGDVQAMTGLDAADAVDALLITGTGGFPEIVQSWRPGVGRADFLHEAVANPLSPLLVAGELSLWLESQPFGRREYDALARDVLAVPCAGLDTPLVPVSRSGVGGSLPLAAHWGSEDLVRAWQ
ncbi:ATP-binding protein [Streptomyces sp. NPDC087787]|uniref:AAA family ATPase n=1 Tax=Streptomyces sp. NPDC087787 TaxID=3365803 RepID=UPI00381AF282